MWMRRERRKKKKQNGSLKRLSCERSNANNRLRLPQLRLNLLKKLLKRRKILIIAIQPLPAYAPSAVPKLLC